MADPRSQAQPVASGDEGDYAEALRLLADPSGQGEVHSAVELLEMAFARGFALAAERLAAFHAMAANGPGGPRHWEQAFAQLLSAAELGSQWIRERPLS